MSNKSKKSLTAFKNAFGSKSTDLIGELSAAVDEAIAFLELAIARVAVLGFDTTEMTADREKLVKRKAKVDNLGEKEKKYAGLQVVNKLALAQTAHADSLTKACKSVMGNGDDKPDESQKSSIYKKVLEDRYKLKIKVPQGMDNTHFDKVFDMFGKVPIEHVGHRKLKKLVYSASEDDKGSGAYGSAEIEMGDFGDAKGVEDYYIDGKKIPANSFNVTTLHEVGHALDDKKKIMKTHMEKSGCGGWKKETIDSVAAAFVAELRKMGLSDQVKESELTKIVKAALKTGATDKPDDLGDDDWKTIEPYLTSHCLPARVDTRPRHYFTEPLVETNGRVYIESYKNEWHSYEFSARAPTKVNNYQWRSPAEWFAEVYAISWLSKKLPPSAVDSAILPYMWNKSI